MDRKNDSVEFGILLVGIGIIWLLFRMDILDFSFMRGLMVLWPGVLIVVGLSIIFSKVRGASTVLWLIFIILILGYGNFYTLGSLEDNVGWINFNVKMHDYKGHETGSFEMKDYDEGHFVLEYPAGDITINDGADGLIDYRQPKDLVDMSVAGSQTAYVNFKIDEWHMGFNGSKNNYAMDYKLNDDIPWDIELNTGAMEGKLDLSNLEVESLEINAAAGDLTVKMSDMADKSYISLNSAAADIDLNLPEEVGVKIDISGLAKDITFVSGEWNKRDGVYYSENYDDADKIIGIDVSLVAGDLNIEQY